MIKGVDITAQKRRRGVSDRVFGLWEVDPAALLQPAGGQPAGGDLFQGRADHLVRSTALQRRPADAAQILRIRTNLSMVFQQFNLWAHMTILENVMEAPVTVLKRDATEVERAARKYLDQVGIGDKCDVYPAQLSGGQQQRAAIARALCMEPEALLFDEPTSALDPELEQEVVKVIKDLAADGRTMLIVTHDMRMAADMSEPSRVPAQGPDRRRREPGRDVRRTRGPSGCARSCRRPARQETIITKPKTNSKMGDN